MAHPISTDELDDLVGVELSGRTPGHRYRVDRRLGGGGQGVVFLATRFAPGGDDTVVVKVWRPSFVAQNPQIAALVLQKESVALARLNDRVPPTPFVVRLLDGGELSVLQRFGEIELPWLVLEYVHGGALGTTLRDRVKESVETSGVAFSPGRARRVLGCVVEGLLAIHEVGVVHRDLKPTNVLLCGVGDDELAKVADFGLARPVGLATTFGGAVAVGTPGYAAPEQMESAKVGPWSDVFSAAALAYFVIAGEDMFAGSPTVQMAKAYSGEFEHLASRPRLEASWKSVKALPRVEDALRRATRRELNARIPSVRELWSALEPAIRDAETAGMATVSSGSARTLQDAVARPWSFHVAHHPPAPLSLRAVAFDPDGHGLGVGERGLWYWEGARWVPLEPPPGLDPSRLRVLRRLAPGRWFTCGDGGEIAVFTPRRLEVHQRIGGAGASLVAASVLSERHFALASREPGRPPALYAFVDGAWLPPVAVPAAAELTSLTPVRGAVAWHVTGRDHEGRGMLFTYRSDTAAVEPWPVDSAALLAAATDSSGAVFAVGAGGFAFRRRVGHAALERVLTHRSLDVVGSDPADCMWAAAVGRILRRPPGAEGGTWTPVWSDSEWQVPFVSLATLAGLVMAAAADGSIVVGQQPQ